MTLLVALLLDRWWGDPPSRWHPVALFGSWARAVESATYADSRLAGSVAWLAAVAVASIPVVVVLVLAEEAGAIVATGVEGLVLWATLGWRSLLEHVADVLHASDLQCARERVGRIVGRDVEDLSETDVRRAALESLAENAADAVVAPIFWGVLGGPLAAVAYRMINTLDATWGHRNSRYHHFGWAAARADDLASWIPSRLTAAFLCLVGRVRPTSELARQASAHLSPNAGWPETLLAHALQVRLGGPVRRAGRLEERPWMGPAAGDSISPESLRVGLTVTRRALILAAACGVLAWR